MSRKKDEDLHNRRRAQILEAAKRCFITDGFHQTSMRQILQSAEMSAGGAYKYFASKADIVKGIAEQDRSDISALELQLVATADPVQGLGKMVEDIIACTDHENAVLATEIHAEACRNAEVGTLIRSNTDALVSIISVAIERGKKAGLITGDYQTLDLAGWLVALIEGYIGRIACDPTLKPVSVARLAKKTALQVVGGSVPD